MKRTTNINLRNFKFSNHFFNKGFILGTMGKTPIKFNYTLKIKRLREDKDSGELFIEWNWYLETTPNVFTISFDSECQILAFTQEELNLFKLKALKQKEEFKKDVARGLILVGYKHSQKILFKHNFPIIFPSDMQIIQTARRNGEIR